MEPLMHTTHTRDLPLDTQTPMAPTHIIYPNVSQDAAAATELATALFAHATPPGLAHAAGTVVGLKGR